jgi:hypothetical protein
VILLSPTSTTAANSPHTLDRIHHFAGLTGGQGLIIVFLLFQSSGNTTNASIDPTLAFTQLQASLLPRTDIPYIPILPISTLVDLPDLLLKHASALSHRHQQPLAPFKNIPKPLELLELATTEPPLDRETVYSVTDCFANLRELAMACTEPGADLRGLQQSSDGFEELRSEGGHGKVATATERLRELRDLTGGQKFNEISDFWAEEWVVE